MDASPLLGRVLAALGQFKLDAVLIGNAAAAILGAPVTTLDFDFMVRDTSVTMRKLEAVAGDMPKKRKTLDRKARLAALSKESERHMEELIHRRLALPIEQRMNFLRKRLPGGGSCL